MEQVQQLTANIKKLERKYLPEDFKVTNWEDLKPYFDELLTRQIN